MTKVVQHQADPFPVLPSRYAHLQTKEVLGTVDQNMQDPLKSFLCFPNEQYSLVLRASETAVLAGPAPQTLHRPPEELGIYDSMQYVQGAARSPVKVCVNVGQHWRHQNAYLTKSAECEDTVMHLKHKLRQSHLGHQTTSWTQP